MAYNPTTWQDGDVITAEKLNNAEMGLASVSGSYEPTEWSDGDVITAKKLNHIEEGIANAGAGGGVDLDSFKLFYCNITNPNNRSISLIQAGLDPETGALGTIEPISYPANYPLNGLCAAAAIRSSDVEYMAYISSAARLTVTAAVGCTYEQADEYSVNVIVPIDGAASIDISLA